MANRKARKDILVEITGEQAEILFMHLDNEIFVLNDDNIEALIDTSKKDFKGFPENFWEVNRFAMEAIEIPEVKE